MRNDEEIESLLPQKPLPNQIPPLSPPKNHKFNAIMVFLITTTMLGVLLTFSYYNSLRYKLPTQSLIHPSIDQRLYSNFTLSNGLQVLAISDPSTVSSSAALSVQIGSYADPPNIIGLAHFIEHLVLLGSNKYPEIDSFKKFVSKHGGAHNAFTTTEETNFHFQISKSAFEPALEMFVQMFANPMFKKEWAESEVAAVDSEYNIDIHKNGWKANFAMKLASNPDGPYARLEGGNKQTLMDYPSQNNIDIVESIKDFFKKHYSANRMSLVVIDSRPTSEIQTLIQSKFSLLNNTKVNKTSYESFPRPFAGEYANKLIQYLPTGNSKVAYILFDIESSRDYNQNNPLDYIYALLNSGGQGSLSSVLKDNGWIMKYKATSQVKSSYFELAGIELTLTKEGINNLAEVTKTILAYLDLIKTKGLEEKIFERLEHTSQYEFDFSGYSGKSNNEMHESRGVASNMNKFPSKYVLSADKTLNKLDPELIQKFLGQMSKDNLLIVISNPDFVTTENQDGSSTSNTVDNTPTSDSEPLITFQDLDKYDSPFQLWYSVSNLSSQFLNSISNVSYTAYPQLRLAPKNRFIPQDFRMVGSQCAGVLCIPLFAEDRKNNVNKVIDEKNLVVWHLLERSFAVPVTTCYVNLNFLHQGDTARGAAISGLFFELLLATLSKDLDEIRSAGHTVVLDNKYLKIEAFSDSFSDVLKTVLRHIRHRNYNQREFEMAKDSYSSFLQSSNRKDMMFKDLKEQILLGKEFTSKDVGSQLDGLGFEDFQAILDTPMQHRKLEILFYGNILEGKAKSYGYDIYSRLKPSFNNIGHVLLEERAESVLDLTNQNLVYMSQDQDVDRDVTMTLNYYQDGPVNIEHLASLKVLSNILSPEAFSYLRTEKKLGYEVSLEDVILKGVMGLGVMVMSATSNTDAVDTEIENFLKNAEEILKGLTEDEVKDVVEAYLETLNYDEKGFQVKGDELFSHILKGDYQFNLREQIKQYLPQVNKTELLSRFENLLQNPKKISYQVYGEDKEDSPEEMVFAEIKYSKTKPRVIKSLGELKDLPRYK